MKHSKKILLVLLVVLLVMGCGIFSLIQLSGSKQYESEKMANESEPVERSDDIIPDAENSIKAGETISNEYYSFSDGTIVDLIVTNNNNHDDYDSASYNLYKGSDLTSAFTVRIYDLSHSEKNIVSKYSVNGSSLVVTNGNVEQNPFFEVTADSLFKLDIQSDDESWQIPLKANVEGTYTMVNLFLDGNAIDCANERVLGYAVITDNRYIITEFNEQYFYGEIALPESNHIYQVYCMTVEAD